MSRFPGPWVPAPKNQRRLVFGALYALAAAAIWFLPIVDMPAQAQARNEAYTPFACANTTGGNNRATLPLTKSGGSHGTGTMYPCLAGVPWNLKVGNLLSTTDHDVIVVADNVYAPSIPTVKFAANGSISLYQMSLAGMQLCLGRSAPSGNCWIGVNNLDANVNNNAVISASSAAAPSFPKPATNYTLKFTPDSGMTIGGAGVLTDLWVTSASRFSVSMENIPFAACSTAGGTSAGENPFFGEDTRVCQNIPISKLNSLDWLVGGADYKIVGMDLTFHYLATHRNDPADPYTQPPVDSSGNPLNSIKMPNTTVTTQ